jgi:uncharacterized protein YbjT (DUF2867 family)
VKALEDALRAAGFPYVIVRPTGLNDQPARGRSLVRLVDQFIIPAAVKRKRPLAQAREAIATFTLEVAA